VVSSSKVPDEAVPAVLWRVHIDLNCFPSQPVTIWGIAKPCVFHRDFKVRGGMPLAAATTLISDHPSAFNVLRSFLA
jgi:hypothetical protein